MTNPSDFPQAGGQAPVRRVGTFTFGLVLVIGGAAMLASLFFPRLDLSLLLKAAPLMLVSLGVETLLAARRGGRVKYDWVGMLLCFLITCLGLVLYCAAWWMLYVAPKGGIHSYA